MAPLIEYSPPRDATALARADERVAAALSEENAYWQTGECRRAVIERRCAEATQLRSTA